MAQPATTVAPMEQWAETAEFTVTDAPMRLHLRVGYERAVVFPEPVSLLDLSPLPFTGVEIDREVALFAPGGAFGNETLVFVGDTTTRRYRFDVSASPYGSRVPLRLRLP